MDLYSLKVIDWSMDTKIGSLFVGKAFLIVTESKSPLSGFIYHSDREGLSMLQMNIQELLKKKGVI